MKKTIKRPMNEQEVLNKLGIKDFRHLSKDKVVEFISMIPNMDPEVAKFAISQFPEFTNTVKSIVLDYKQEIESVLKSNDDSMKSCYESSQIILNALDKMLDKDEDLTFEERMQIIEKMQEIQQSIDDKDTENKKFIRNIAYAVSLVTVFTIGTAATLLGGNFKFPKNKG